MTKLETAVRRVTKNTVGRFPIVLTIAPAGAQAETLIGLRLLGKRTEYVVALSDLYRIAAIWHGAKESKARKEARRNGVPWKRTKKIFQRENSIPNIKRSKNNNP